MATLTWKVRVLESAWGATWRTWPVACTCESSLRASATTGSRGPVRMSCSGMSKTASSFVMPGQLHDRLSGLHDLAGIGARLP